MERRAGGREKETAFHHARLTRQQLLPNAAQQPQLKGTGAAETPRTFFFLIEGKSHISNCSSDAIMQKVNKFILIRERQKINDLVAFIATTFFHLDARLPVS